MFTPIKREPYNVVNEMGPDFQTPRATPSSFSKELRQVLQERNLLTAKSRKKVCALLDGSRYSPNINSPNTEMDKRKTFRRQAIQEIITSERTYLSHLEMLMQYFVRPLKEQAIISVASHTALFGQIEMIYNLNGELLRELEDNMDNVAKAFLKMAPFLKLYSVYAFDYRNALFIVEDLTCKNPVFRKFLAETESRPEVQRKLNSLMIVPIQRVPRYKLLLEQVLLYTSPADGDFKLLKESVKQIESTVSHLNACVEDQEVTLLLINLQNSLMNRTPNIVKPSRKVIKEGVLHKITRNGTEIKRYCVLMSDIFMYCKMLKERTPNTVVENSLECCCIFPLKKSKVYELFPGKFKVTCQGDGIILSTMDIQLGRAWVGFIRDAIELHIQCRKTLRKESSHRKPIRKKDIKKFDNDFVISPNKRKSEYDTVFRNRNRCTDSEDETDDYNMGSGCFPRKKLVQSKLSVAVPVPLNRSIHPLKRRAPLPPDAALENETRCGKNISGSFAQTANCVTKFCKFIGNDKHKPRGILKSTTSNVKLSTIDHDPTYGFANRYSENESYFLTHKDHNALPTSIKREDIFEPEMVDGNFRDVLYPLRSSGGSGKSNTSGTLAWSLSASAQKENDYTSPPQKKRVKFDFAQNRTVKTDSKDEPFIFNTEVVNSTKMSLGERIYNFFSKLF